MKAAFAFPELQERTAVKKLKTKVLGADETGVPSQDSPRDPPSGGGGQTALRLRGAPAQG
jgi:hypothetical protein